MPVHGIQLLGVAKQKRREAFWAEAHRALPPRRLRALLDVEVNVRLVSCADAQLGTNSCRRTLGRPRS
eukprot:1830186-Lingulodinium_polyedra.AAC.1